MKCYNCNKFILWKACFNHYFIISRAGEHLQYPVCDVWCFKSLCQRFEDFIDEDYSFEFK